MNRVPKRILKIVEKKLGIRVLKEILEFIETKKPDLWGEKQGPEYLTVNVILTIYKDTCAKGYSTVAALAKLKNVLHGKTFAHNAKVLRKALAEWGRSQVTLDSKEDWNRAAKNIKLGKSVAKANLWIDSVDFPTTKKPYRKSKKGDWWSFKLNKPGVRYTFIRDGESRIQKVWEGYSETL